MLVHVVPVSEGMPEEEVMGRIQSGWVKFGRQVVRGSGVIDPTKHMGGVGLQDVDIWILPQPMIPARALATALQHVLSGRPHAKTALNDFTQALVGVDLEDFLARAQPPRREEDGQGNGVGQT